MRKPKKNAFHSHFQIYKQTKTFYRVCTKSDFFFFLKNTQVTFYPYLAIYVKIRNQPMTLQSEHDPGKEMCLRLNT